MKHIFTTKEKCGCWGKWLGEVEEDSDLVDMGYCVAHEPPEEENNGTDI